MNPAVISRLSVALLFLGVEISRAQLPGCIPPPPGVTAWWRGEGNGLDNEGVAHGTVMGGGYFTNAMVGRGFLFSGSGDDFIGLPTNIFPIPNSGSGNQPFSFEVWFKTTAGGVILGQQDQAPFNTTLAGNVPGLYVGTNGHLYAQLFWGADDPLETSMVIADGIFHHAIVTYDGSTQILYVDGAVIDSTSFSQEGYAGTYFYQFGTGWTDGWPATPGGWFPFTGIVDEPTLYARALAGNEVMALFTAGSGGKCAPPTGPALVHRYSFNEEAGSSIAADSVSSSHGTLLFATVTPPYTNGVPDGSGFTGAGRLRLQGTNGYVSMPPRLVSWLSNATFEAWITWYGPSNSVWQRIWDLGFNDQGTNASGIGTNYLIFSPARGGSELPGFEETIVNPFGSESDANSVILSGPNKLPLGQPTYVAVTYDPGAGRSQLFVNGSLVSSISKPLNPMLHFTDYNNWLGRSQWTRDPFFNGEYDEFRIWDGVLSQQEIADHFAGGPDQQFVRVRPFLFLSRASSEVVISWTTNYTAQFRLESAANPRATNWLTITNAVTVTNGLYQVRLPATQNAAFCRLKR